MLFGHNLGIRIDDRVQLVLLFARIVQRGATVITNLAPANTTQSRSGKQ